jgi:hypothetical protein
MRPAYLLLATAAFAASPGAGVWRGGSLCTNTASACRNETVVYYIRDVPGHPDLLFVRADKIVDGKAITMGSGNWQYDRTRQTIEWRMPQQVWLLRLDADRIQGTLTLADGSVFRKMTLKKDD